MIIMSMLDTVSGVFGKAFVKNAIIIGCTAYVCFWVSAKTRDFELALRKELGKNTDILLAQNKRIESLENSMWTVQMMSAWNQIFAEWNPTNSRTPDALRVYQDMRSGRQPVGVRIGP